MMIDRYGSLREKIKIGFMIVGFGLFLFVGFVVVVLGLRWIV